MCAYKTHQCCQFPVLVFSQFQRLEIVYDYAGLLRTIKYFKVWYVYEQVCGFYVIPLSAFFRAGYDV